MQLMKNSIIDGSLRRYIVMPDDECHPSRTARPLIAKHMPFPINLSKRIEILLTKCSHERSQESLEVCATNLRTKCSEF